MDVMLCDVMRQQVYFKRIVYTKAGKLWEGMFSGGGRFKCVFDWTSLSEVGKSLKHIRKTGYL